MIVSLEDKVRVWDVIIGADGEGAHAGWDGRTFEGLHEVCDANRYLEPIWEKYGTDFESKCAAANEVIEYLNERFAVNYSQEDESV